MYKIERQGNLLQKKCVNQLNSANHSKLVNLFRNAHSLAKHNRPYSDFVWIADLDAKKGIDVGESYRNAKYCKSFVKAIAHIELCNLKQDIENIKFLTMISDGVN